MKVLNSEKDYAQLMATAAEEKLKTALKEAVDLRAQVKERFKAFHE